MKAYVHTKCRRADGFFDTYQTQSVEVKETETPHHGHTASGYGARIPTRYMIRYNGRWRRVYAICYSNAATLYIGHTFDPCLTVGIWSE